MASSSDFDPITDVLGEEWREQTDKERVLAGKPTEAQVKRLLQGFNLNLFYNPWDHDQPIFKQASNGCRLYRELQDLKEESKQALALWREPPRAQKRKSEVLSSTASCPQVTPFMHFKYNSNY
jgi:hypothetical protein